MKSKFIKVLFAGAIIVSNCSVVRARDVIGDPVPTSKYRMINITSTGTTYGAYKTVVSHDAKAAGDTTIGYTKAVSVSQILSYSSSFSSTVTGGNI